MGANPMANMMQQMMQNPQMMQQAMQMMQNPQMSQMMMQNQGQSAGATPFATPGAAPLGAHAATPGMTGASPFGTLAANPWAANPNLYGSFNQGANPFQQMAQMMNPHGGGFGGQQGSGESAVPESVQKVRFASQLMQLANMGFCDEGMCLRALAQHNGRLDSTIDMLLTGSVD